MHARGAKDDSMIENVDALGVILVDHGSRYQAANDMLADVADEFREATGVSIVEVAHMELAEPTLEQAFARCVARGAKRIVVQPYFLAPGRHSTTDIPAMIATIAPWYPGLSYCIAEPLGVDRHIADILARRISEAIVRHAADADPKQQ